MLLAIGIFLLGSVSFVRTNHFLGGTITWRPLNLSATGSPVAIVITQTYLWTEALMSCSNALIASNGFIPTYAGVSTSKLTCIRNCGAGSTGYSPVDVIPRCTDVSTAMDLSVGQRSDIVYLQAGNDFSVAYQDTSWRPLATNPTADWSLASRINLATRSDNGLFNNAPITTMMSPITIPRNRPTVIHIPVSGADKDVLRCRWATASNGVDECGQVCPPGSLPTGTILFPNCTMIITGQVIGDWFAVAVMVEDFINSSSTTPLSSVPVQFLVNVVSPPTCPTPPEIIGEATIDSCIPVQIGVPFSMKLVAINYCGSSVIITDIATLSFSGLNKGILNQTNTSIYTKLLTWTPTSAQSGYQLICAMAYDSADTQSSQYCFTFYVAALALCSCPSVPCLTTTSTTTSTSTSTSVTTGTSSTTSTTTSNTTITTTSATTTLATTDANKNEETTGSYSWLLPVMMLGVPFLLGLAVSIILCCHYCCPWSIGKLKLSDCEGPFELYHIEAMKNSTKHGLHLRTSRLTRYFPVTSNKHNPTFKRPFLHSTIHTFTLKKQPDRHHQQFKQSLEIKKQNTRINRITKISPIVLKQASSPSNRTIQHESFDKTYD